MHEGKSNQPRSRRGARRQAVQIPARVPLGHRPQGAAQMQFALLHHQSSRGIAPCKLRSRQQELLSGSQRAPLSQGDDDAAQLLAGRCFPSSAEPGDIDSLACRKPGQKPINVPGAWKRCDAPIRGHEHFLDPFERHPLHCAHFGRSPLMARRGCSVQISVQKAALEGAKRRTGDDTDPAQAGRGSRAVSRVHLLRGREADAWSRPVSSKAYLAARAFENVPLMSRDDRTGSAPSKQRSTSALASSSAPAFSAKPPSAPSSPERTKLRHDHRAGVSDISCLVPLEGLEPPTVCLGRNCSSIELQRLAGP